MIRRAVCDPDAFYPLRSLVEGPFDDWGLLEPLERFVRGIVLHDEMAMELEPHPYDPNSDIPDDRPPGPYNVIVAYGPTLDGYEPLFIEKEYGARVAPALELFPAVLDLAAKLSNSRPGAPGSTYFTAHVEFIQRTLQVVVDGGSAVCGGLVWQALDQQQASFPPDLFARLDKGWGEFARSADAGQIGPPVPPVLSIVLSRTATREKLCAVLADLRNEWAEPRAKVWAIVDRMKSAQDLEELNELRQQLADAARYFSPAPSSSDARPLRILWNVLLESSTGAATAFLSGGAPSTGAAVGGVNALARTATKAVPDSLDALLRRGAYDLAARVRRATARVEPMPGLLLKFLTRSEIQKLGL